MIVGIIIITSPANSAPQSVGIFKNLKQVCHSDKYIWGEEQVPMDSSQKSMALNIVMVAPGFAGTITLG